MSAIGNEAYRKAVKSHEDQRLEAKILELANTFPSLRGMCDVWDPIGLDQWAESVASSGQIHAARFVLQVWDKNYVWGCGTFNVCKAMHVWDENHWQAFLAWAGRPFTL